MDGTLVTFPRNFSGVPTERFRVPGDLLNVRGAGRNRIRDGRAADVLIDDAGAINRERALPGEADVQWRSAGPVGADGRGARRVAGRAGRQHVDGARGVFLLHRDDVAALDGRVATEVGTDERVGRAGRGRDEVGEALCVAVAATLR